jgi:hypothetical protein
MQLLDPAAESSFPDVLRSDWFYAVAASAEKERLAVGFEDGAFRGNSPIPKDQMVVIAANCLARAMDYHLTADPETLLETYNDRDTLADWAKSGIALATQTGVVPYRADGNFDPQSAMTRGDAAIMLYRLVMKMW